MKKLNLCLCLLTHLMVAVLIMISGCDSGEKARDEVTGKRAVKQYHEATKDIGKITDKQAKKYEGIAEEKKEEGKRE